MFYYAQSLSDDVPSLHLDLPGNTVWCGRKPDLTAEGKLSSTMGRAGAGRSSLLGLVGYDEAVAAAESAFRNHFPDLKWLSELDPDSYEEAAGSDGQRSGARPTDEDDAIEALEQALCHLQQPDVPEAPPGAQPEANLS